MDIKTALDEILFYETLQRGDTWYLEIKTGHVTFLTEEDKNAGVSELPSEEYVKCPDCGPYITKEYILSRQFNQELLEKYEIDIPLTVEKFCSRDCVDEHMRTFVRNTGRMRHDLHLILDYREFRKPLMKKLAEEWLNEIQNQITASHP